MRGLFGRRPSWANTEAIRSLPPLGLLKTNAGSAAIFVNEFHARSFKASSHNLKRCVTGLMRAGLELTNGHNTNSGLVCEFLLAPIEQTTGSSTLCSRNHHLKLHKRMISTIPSKND